MKSGAVPIHALGGSSTVRMSDASGFPFPVFRGSLAGSESQEATGPVSNIDQTFGFKGQTSSNAKSVAKSTVNKVSDF